LSSYNAIGQPPMMARPAIARPAKAPVGPSAPLKQVYPVLPGITAPYISTTRNTRDGRGVIVPVTASQSTAILVTHNLGRIPQSIQAIQNNGGQFLNPGMILSAGGIQPTRTQATIEGNQQMINCLVRFE
jgi:hypothetical protein